MVAIQNTGIHRSEKINIVCIESARMGRNCIKREFYVMWREWFACVKKINFNPPGWPSLLGDRNY